MGFAWTISLQYGGTSDFPMVVRHVQWWSISTVINLVNMIFLKEIYALYFSRAAWRKEYRRQGNAWFDGGLLFCAYGRHANLFFLRSDDLLWWTEVCHVLSATCFKPVVPITNRFQDIWSSMTETWHGGLKRWLAEKHLLRSRFWQWII